MQGSFAGLGNVTLLYVVTGFSHTIIELHNVFRDLSNNRLTAIPNKALEGLDSLTFLCVACCDIASSWNKKIALDRLLANNLITIPAGTQLYSKFASGELKYAVNYSFRWNSFRKFALCRIESLLNPKPPGKLAYLWVRLNNWVFYCYSINVMNSGIWAEIAFHLSARLHLKNSTIWCSCINVCLWTDFGRTHPGSR